MKTRTTVKDKLLAPPEVAERWGVSVGYLANCRFAGKGPAFIKIGSAVRYRESDLVEWEEANTHTPRGTGDAA